MSEQRAITNASTESRDLRPLPVGCSRCGWSVNLVASVENPENYDVTPLDGWELAPGKHTFCERCAGGWDPRIQEMSAALHALEQWDMLALRPDGHGMATADAPWARDLIARALRG